MEAEPSALVVERDEEQVAPRQRGRAPRPSRPAPSRHHTTGQTAVREPTRGSSAPAPAGHAPRVPRSPGNRPRGGSSRRICSRKRGGRQRAAARAPRDRAPRAILPFSLPGLRHLRVVRPSPRRPFRKASASAEVNRRSSARSSSSSPWARRVATGSVGSVLLASTSWNPGGAWSMNQPTLARAGALDSRWKSSRMSVISPWPSSSLTRRGRTTSTTGATTAGAGLATAGLARYSASIACVHRTTGSLSPSSSVSHATGLRSASASRHAASRVVFPKPAGQATRVSLRSDPLRRRSSKALARNRQLAHRRRMQFRADQDQLLPALPNSVARDGVLQFRHALTGLRLYLTKRPGRYRREARRLLRRAHGI